MSTTSVGSADEQNASVRKYFAHCVQKVRESDYENYVWAMQLPKELRPAIFALRAFNVEIAAIADQVKGPMLVTLRMQWWRDAVNGMYKGIPIKHPAIHALSQVNQRQPLTRYRLQQIVSAREKDLLEPDPPPDIAALEKYAEGTASQLLQLQLEAAGQQTREAEVVASQLGKAVGMTAVLKGTGFHAQKRRSYLPADLCEQEGLHMEDLFAGQSSDQLRNVVFNVASTAKGHLDAARDAGHHLTPEARRLMLPAVSTGLFLNALERADFDPFSPRLARNGGYSTLWHQLATKYKLLRGQF